MEQTENRNKHRFSAQYLVRLSVLVAILFFLEISGLGIIKTPGLEFTIMQVPVIIGAITMGPSAGGILGGIFGLISFWECFGRSAFGAILLSIHPVGTFLVCVPTRILMGILCGLIFRILKKLDKTGLWSFGAASLAGALLNTLFFMTTLVVFFYPTDYIQGFVRMLGVANPFGFVLAFVGVQGLLEAIICFLAGAAISKALYHVMHRK
ncbi:MAG: ECF transporter S component [Intestinimonas sp.]|jgi:uncharacterized membrane protein|nr:ECF transporter S component [Intestinimonas sp.]